MGVSDLLGERPAAGPSAQRPQLLWGGLGPTNPANPGAPRPADASMVDADEPMDADQHGDAEVAPAYAQHELFVDQDEIENDRRAFGRPNQARGPSASAGAPSSAGGPSSGPGAAANAADDKARLAAPLNHHTPVTRFLSRQTLGFIPKLSARPGPLADAAADAGGPREPLTSPLSGGFRLPSLSSTPPLSPHKWTGAGGGAGGGDEDGRLPAFLGFPQRVSSCGSLSDKFATMSTRSAAIPSLREALERGARSDSGASTSSSSTAAGPSAGSAGSPSVPTGMLTMRDICRPMAYQRSASCPSDPTVSSALLLAAATEASSAAARSPFLFADDAPDALSSPSSSFGSSPQFEDESEEDEAGGRSARSARARPVAASPSPPTNYRSLSLLDLTHSRLERSSSMDGAAPRPPAESIDLYQWLDRQSLHSLADSALAAPRLCSSAAAAHTELAASVHHLAAVHPAVDPLDARREKKLCAFPQCASNAVTRGLCISHGGGRRCQRKGCTRGAQSKGLCVAHGGGRICRAKGCSNIQRSMGLCIRHGGGRRCCVPGCRKGVVRQDLCTAHGGKRKCRVDDCNKHVKKRGLCRAHANSLAQAAAAPLEP